MSITLLAMSRTDPANSSRSAVSVFDLEKNRLGIGQFVWLENGCLSGEKAKAEKTADFLRNYTVTAAWNESARFVRKPESQMKRKASVTPSPFDRGLLLGRRAFLF